jgi:SAM-dependent methyltransferase
MAPYAWAVAVGSFLLFLVQPLAGKYLLPWFGGGPAVWTTCLLFFQALLLAGYVYAHLLTRHLRLRLQLALHATLLLSCLAFLPVAFQPGRLPDAGESGALAVLGVLAASISVPFFALATTSPLLQAWLAIAEPGGRRQYRLYALSNAAALVAVAAYPFVMEPLLSLAAQARWWSAGLLVYLGLALLAGWTTARRAVTGGADAAAAPGWAEPAPSRPGRLTAVAWLTLPACSSLLLLAVTQRISQDVAPVPFLWLLPLGLYLVTWIVCFERSAWYRRAWVLPALLLSVTGVAAVLFLRAFLSAQVQIAVYAAALLSACLACHGELARLQPPPRYLTTFYLAIGLGGFLGSGLVVVVAPWLFTDGYELQLGLLACLVLLLGVASRDPASRLYRGRKRRLWAYLVGALLVLALAFQQEAMRFHRQRLAAVRNFYGALAVLDAAPGDPQKHHRLLQNGAVLHGLQVCDPARRALTTAYYGEASGVGLLLRHLGTDRPRRIGMLGLGVGTLAAYGRAGDVVRFYELDPAVERLAREWFTYLADTPARVEVVLGDGRRRLEEEPPQGFDVLVLDVFSSDAVPVHVLTREAFRLYLRHLAPGGVVAVNVSSRHLDLGTVVAAVASDAGLRVEVIEHHPAPDEWWLRSSQWALLSAGNGSLPGPALASARHVALPPPRPAALWTDDHAALLPVLKPGW